MVKPQKGILVPLGRLAVAGDAIVTALMAPPDPDDRCSTVPPFDASEVRVGVQPGSPLDCHSEKSGSNIMPPHCPSPLPEASHSTRFPDLRLQEMATRLNRYC